MLPAEVEWIDNPACLEPVKMRLPPFLGHQHLKVQQLAGLLSGKAARWLQVPLTADGLNRAIGNEIGLWLRAGYTPTTQLKLWSKVAVNRSVVIRIKRLLRSLRGAEQITWNTST